LVSRNEELEDRRMLQARKSRVPNSIPLILIVVAWQFAYAGAEPPTEWQSPAGWWSGDIGATDRAATQTGSTFEVNGDRPDIWDAVDCSSGWFTESESRFEATFRVSRGAPHANDF
jgi:hypothetical protein